MSVKTKQPSTELVIAVEGKVINSNFEAYKEYATSQIEGISFDLKTDEDFDRAELDAKGLKNLECRLTKAKADFLAQMDEVNQLLGSVDELGNLARETRLELEKLVKRRKTEVREAIIRDGIAALEVRTREFSDMISEAIKGKSALSKMQDAVTAVVESINERIDANRVLFKKAASEHGDAVAYAQDAFVCLPVDVAVVEMERRIERHRAAIKESKLKAEAEKLRREAQPTESVIEQVGTLPPTKDVVSPAGLSQEQEWASFLGLTKAAFAPLKTARSQLRHGANVSRAQDFADALSVAWKQLNEGGAR